MTGGCTRYDGVIHGFFSFADLVDKGAPGARVYNEGARAFNNGEIDVYTLGRDGRPGGEGVDQIPVRGERAAGQRAWAGGGGNRNRPRPDHIRRDP